MTVSSSPTPPLLSAHLGSSSTPALAYSCLTLLVPKPHFQGHTSWTCINLSYSTTVICSSELVMHSHFCSWWSYPSCSDTSLPDSHTSWTCVNLSYSTTVICSSAFVVHSHFDLHGHTPLVPTPHFQTATPHETVSTSPTPPMSSARLNSLSTLTSAYRRLHRMYLCRLIITHMNQVCYPPCLDCLNQWLQPCSPTHPHLTSAVLLPHLLLGLKSNSPSLH